MAGNGEQGFDLGRIVLPADATTFRGIADTAIPMDPGVAFSPPVEELRGANW